MDGGGFNSGGGERASQRNSGVLPVNSHIILASQGINASVTYNDHALGAVQRYIGTLEQYETSETNYTLLVSDYCVEQPVYVTVTKGQLASFDEETCEMYKGHVIEVIGLLDNHIDHGRSLKALSIREVVSPYQLVGHQMEVSLQFKRWNENGESNKENVGNSSSNSAKPGAAPTSGSNPNDLVENLIKKLGESETWGCKRMDIYAQCSLPKPKVDQAIQFLIDEGMIYNTLDDDTFKSSDQ